MKSKIIFLIFITTLMMSCDKDDEILKSPLENSNIIRVDNNLFLNAPYDDFEIVSAAVNGNNLSLTIFYGGGCGKVYYDLITGNDYLDTDPIQKNIRLAFDDRDNCEAGLELELTFDLTEIQISSTEKISINLDRWKEPIEYHY